MAGFYVGFLVLLFGVSLILPATAKFVVEKNSLTMTSPDSIRVLMIAPFETSEFLNMKEPWPGWLYGCISEAKHEGLQRFQRI